MRFLALTLPFVIASLSAASTASASCGSAFCTLMTDPYAQGTGEVSAGWSADVRLESIVQNRLRSGTSSVDARDVRGEDAIERHTKNLNLTGSLSYGLNADWSATLRVPLLRRDHLHETLDDSSDKQAAPEQWRFTRVGDLQALARRQFSQVDGAQAFAVFGGLKLPTGSTSVSNRDGSRAERALQPGTGTTDLIVGAALRRVLRHTDAVFAQVSLGQALNSSDGFRPGQRIEASAGWSHAWSGSLATALQVNARHRGRDAGAQAEPDNSGSTTLDLSPGITLGLGAASLIYAYLQVPVYQQVNGVQLVPRHALALGWTIAL